MEGKEEEKGGEEERGEEEEKGRRVQSGKDTDDLANTSFEMRSGAKAITVPG